MGGVMFKVYLCMAEHHDWRFILAATLGCAVSTSTTFWLYSQTQDGSQTRRVLWLALTGLVAGDGIWTTHFVAMLAFHTGLPTGYGLSGSLASFAAAIAGCCAGFATASQDAGKGSQRATVTGGL